VPYFFTFLASNIEGSVDAAAAAAAGGGASAAGAATICGGDSGVLEIVEGKFMFMIAHRRTSLSL